MGGGAVTVVGMWESGWMEPERTERRLWKQTIQAFAVDRWIMCPPKGGPFTSPLQHEDLGAALEQLSGPKTFLIPPRRSEAIDLVKYEHPEQAIYVFGNSNEDLTRYVTEADEVVSICTPAAAAMFGHVALGIALYDRLVKSS